MWSFVGKKGNKQWIWLAIDVDTREIVGVYVGDRSEKSARELWRSLPGIYRQCALAYTDFWNAYALVFPSKRYKAVGKETGKTNAIERFNCTMRQRISRLVRKTLSFSKKLENHIAVRPRRIEFA
jgi:insertion element IS1 protein InsB